MIQIPEKGDKVNVTEFMFTNDQGHQIFVNNNILSGPKYSGPALSEIVKAWEDYETGWRYHAKPLSPELVQFLQDNRVKKSSPIYTDQFSVKI